VTERPPPVAGTKPRQARARHWLAGMLLLLAIISGTVGAAALCFRDTVVDGREFAERVTSALASNSAREVIGRQVADQIISASPHTIAVRPIIESTVESALGTPSFQRILVAAVNDLHGTLLLGRGNTLTLRLIDVVLLAKSQLAVYAPAVAAAIPDSVTDALVRISAGDLTLETAGILDRINTFAVLAPGLTLALLAGYVFATQNRRRAVLISGIAVASMGALLIIGLRILRIFVLRGFPDRDARTVASAVWKSLTVDVRPLGLGLAAVGAAVAVAVTLSTREAPLRTTVASLARFVAVPERRRARAVWCLAALALGALLLADAGTVVSFVLTMAGAVLVMTALTEGARLVGPPPTAVGVLPRRQRRPYAYTGIVAVVALVGAATVIAVHSRGRPAQAAALTDDPRCNGDVLLCDRRLDQVVIPATHNSNASAADGYLIGNQPRGIPSQLNAGYRGLLIDVYFGLRRPGSNIVLTDRAPLTAAQRARQVSELGEPAVAAAEQVRARVASVGGTRSTYLCHSFCEIGATPFEPELVTIRKWLHSHPREVLVLFLQDEIPPEPIVEAFQQAKLDRYAIMLHRNQPLPTLQEMIDSDKRLVVLAEKHVSTTPWYLNGFSFVQETPFTFRRVSNFKCAANRGQPDSPLFLVNHFVTPASAPETARANSRNVLEKRLIECERERGKLPNLVAVDFYDLGDVLPVVREANDTGLG
jgi:hypothetical protein